MRTHCSYCKGNTTEDFYGNCSACGAPKDAKYLPKLSDEEVHQSYFPTSGTWYGYEVYQQIHQLNDFRDSMKGNTFLDYMPEPQKKHSIPEFVRSLLRR